MFADQADIFRTATRPLSAHRLVLPPVFGESRRMVIYRYGAMAWVWRVLAGGGLVAGLLLCALAWRGGLSGGVWIALPLMLPALLLCPMVAVRIDRLDDGRIEIRTLAFWRRRLLRSELGTPRSNDWIQGGKGSRYAPRIWVPVRGGFPIHVDLWGEILDRRAFLAVFALSARDLPGRS